ncbi:spexin prohormone 2 isoform X1 [Oryzias latipes]
MKTKALVIWTCSLVISLFIDYCHAQKLNIHWGPQSMMYLKGKYGKRFVSEDNNRVWKRGLNSLHALLKGRVEGPMDLGTHTVFRTPRVPCQPPGWGFVAGLFPLHSPLLRESWAPGTENELQ